MVYDPEANILSWEVGQGEINHVREFSNFIIHLSHAGKPILIEVLEASNFFGQLDKVKLTDLKKIIAAEGQNI